jgi:hypothetical protein
MCRKFEEVFTENGAARPGHITTILFEIGDVDFLKHVVKRLCNKTIFPLRNLNLKSSRT